MDDIDQLAEGDLRREIHDTYRWSAGHARISKTDYCLGFRPVEQTHGEGEWSVCGKDARNAYANALRELRAGKHRRE
jgi:hypothetical protein